MVPVRGFRLVPAPLFDFPTFKVALALISVLVLSNKKYHFLKWKSFYFNNGYKR